MDGFTDALEDKIDRYYEKHGVEFMNLIKRLSAGPPIYARDMFNNNSNIFPPHILNGVAKNDPQEQHIKN